MNKILSTGFNREELKYRNGVVAYIIDGLGNILLIQKTTYPDHLWTFPGGGVEEGEELLQALFRELGEEICTTEQNFKLIGKSTKTLDYEWDDNTVRANIEKNGFSYRGQKNHQFVFEYVGDKKDIKPNEDEKIKTAKWVLITEIEEYLNFEGQKESVRPVLEEFNLGKNLTLKSIIGDYNNFLDTLLNNIKSAGIDISNFQIDHIALRTESLQEYKKINKFLSPFTSLVGEIEIRNRPICIFRFQQSLIYKSFLIPFLEVISPAENNTFKFGLEHIEIVVPREKLFQLESLYPNVEFNSKNMDRVVNPELILYFKDGFSVKFHPLPVDEAQKIQKETGKL